MVILWGTIAPVQAKTKASYITNLTTVTRKNMGDVIVTWDRNDNVTGYEIDYSLKSHFSKKTTKVIKKKTTTTLTLKNLPKKSIYVRIRGYKKGKKTTYSSYRRCKVIAWNSKWTYAAESKIHKDAAVLFYAPSKRKNKVVCINPGHGTRNGSKYQVWCHPDHSKKIVGGTGRKGATKTYAITAGATMLNKTTEANANLAVSKKLKKELMADGYDVLMVRQDSNAQLDNIARTVYANNNADCHVAIHYDSSQTDKGAFFISVPNVKSYLAMKPVKSHYKQHNALGNKLIAGLKAKGIKLYKKGYKALDLTQTSYSTIPSVDIEVGDRKSSTSSSRTTKVAAGIAKGIKDYFKH